MQMSGFVFEENRGYTVVRFETDLHEMSWGDVENEASEIVTKIKAANTSRLIVDLSPMDLIQSGLVASLVRMWKATESHVDRKVVVETPNEVVRDVIRTAGLFKVFTVVNTREEAAYEIGVSKGARLEQREKRVLAWIALPAAILAIVALFPVFYMTNTAVKGNAELAGFLLAASACIASLFSMTKDDGWRRGLGAIAMVLALTVFGSLYMNHYGSGLPGVEQDGAGEDSNGPKQPDDSLEDEGRLTARGKKNTDNFNWPKSPTADPPNSEETADGDDGTPTEDETDKPSEPDSDDN
jgi:anti-anti-sigma regulatory factor